MSRAAEAAAAWRARGLRVAVVRGAFDLLHVGHARRLAEVRSSADRLVVVVESDRAAERLGPGRPVVSRDDRARLVAALRGVDLVVLPDDGVTLDFATKIETIDDGVEAAGWERLRAPGGAP